MNPNLSRYKEGRVAWDEKYAQVFPDGAPCFFERTDERRGWFNPLFTREVALLIAEVHNRTVEEGDGDYCWLVFDGADLQVSRCDYDPDGSYTLEPNEDGLYDLSDFPWDRLEYCNHADEDARRLRLRSRARGRRFRPLAAASA